MKGTVKLKSLLPYVSDNDLDVIIIAQRLIQGQNFFEYLEVSLFWFRYLIENTSLDQKSDKF